MVPLDGAARRGAGRHVKFVEQERLGACFSPRAAEQLVHYKLTNDIIAQQCVSNPRVWESRGSAVQEPREKLSDDRRAGAPDSRHGTDEPSLNETVLIARPADDGKPKVDHDPIRSQARACGRYRLECLLGSGSFGEVWSGFDPELNRPVAVKRLRTDRVLRTGTNAAFLEEGRKLAQLKQPGIVTVYDVGCQDGEYYIVSELMTGGTLGDRLAKSDLSHGEACRIALELATALKHVHHCGIMHRDIKPENVLLDEAGRPKLADFGLAVTEVEQLSEHPSALGTLAYMSPEQARGESHLVDCRTDIYSLGILLYRMLTGRTPFVAQTYDQWREQILHREPRPPRSIDNSIPPRLEEICLRCLNKRVTDRYTTAADLATDLKEVLGDAHKRFRVPLLAAGLLLIALVSGVTIAVISGHFRSRFWNDQPRTSFNAPSGDAPLAAQSHLEGVESVELVSVIPSPRPILIRIGRSMIVRIH